MRVVPTALAEVLLVEPVVHRDPRGFFFESYHAGRYRQAGIDGRFVQDNHSRSVAGTLRGLHAQLAHPQGKLVRALEGTIFDVAVDLRPASPSFGRWVAATLSAENFLQLWVPPGFAHGFCTLSPVAQVEYKCTGFYRPEDEIGVVFDDPDLGIPWPVAVPRLSAKDRALPRLADLIPRLRAAAGERAGA